jgi:hypothetical protein
MISAHPMLWLSLSQPGINFHASYLSLRMIPTPQEEEASTQNLMEVTGGGLANEDPQKLSASWDRHQVISDKTLGLGVN